MGPLGIEPRTIRLKVECSTAELQARRTTRMHGSEAARTICVAPGPNKQERRRLNPQIDLARVMPMRLPRISALAAAALIAPLLLAACASKPMQTVELTTRNGVNEAAHAPFEDFNLVRSRIPVVLLQAGQDPYSRPQPLNCDGLSKELARLDDALGPDFDVAQVKRSNMDRGAAYAAGAGARAMKDLTEGWIPMRSWVRYMSGAEQHSKDVTSAISAGQARRAYLKGLAQSEGCVNLGPAQPVYLFPAPPHTASSVAQN